MTHKQANSTVKRTKLKKQPKVVASAPAVASTAPTNHDGALRRVIEITTSAFDAQKIAVALAKEYPEIFVKLHEATTSIQNWHRDVVTAVYQGNPVAAIKLTREKTGLGLKEAKDVIDNLRVFMSQNGYMMTVRNEFITALTEANQVVYNQLCVSARNLK
jgi:ribosomal protein L7/L12